MVTLPANRLVAGLLLAALAGGCSEAEVRSTDAPPAEAAPADTPGTFARLDVDGRRDRLDDLLAARDHAIELIDALASASEGDMRTVRAPSGTLETPAQRLRAVAGEARAALDDLKAPSEINGSVRFMDWFREGIGTIHRRLDEPRRPSHSSDFEAAELIVQRGAGPTLAVRTSDLWSRSARPAVDGGVDLVYVEWRGGGAELSFVLPEDVDLASGVVEAHVNFGDGQVLKLSSPRLNRFLAIATARFHRPLAELFAKARGNGTLRVLAPRAGPPAGTSFPLPASTAARVAGASQPIK